MVIHEELDQVDGLIVGASFQKAIWLSALANMTEQALVL